MMQENSKKNGSSLIYVGNPDPGKQVDGGCFAPKPPLRWTPPTKGGAPPRRFRLCNSRWIHRLSFRLEI